MNRARVFGWLYQRLRDREQRVGIRLFAFALGAMAVFQLFLHMPPADGVWREFKDPQRAPASGQYDRKIEGKLWLFELNGGKYECRGGDVWPPNEPAANPHVVYERSAPRKCRAAPSVGRLSYFELHNLWLLLSMFALGAALLLIDEHDRGVRLTFTHGMLIYWPFAMAFEIVWRGWIV